MGRADRCVHACMCVDMHACMCAWVHGCPRARPTRNTPPTAPHARGPGTPTASHLWHGVVVLQPLVRVDAVLLTPTRLRGARRRPGVGGVRTRCCCCCRRHVRPACAPHCPRTAMHMQRTQPARPHLVRQGEPHERLAAHRAAAPRRIHGLLQEAWRRVLCGLCWRGRFPPWVVGL
jgi:hypothetical protein